ncbi:MAG TPA: hypothetical protein VF678_01660, partial [bacterium]
STFAKPGKCRVFTMPPAPMMPNRIGMSAMVPSLYCDGWIVRAAARRAGCRGSNTDFGQGEI